MENFNILIISNNCLSQHNSNGRTLLNMLGKIRKENIYQIYTSGEYTDKAFCNDFLRLTNGDVMRSYWGKVPSNVTEKPIENTSTDNVGKTKNAYTMLLRDLAWDWSLGIKRYVIEWVKKCNPQVVLLQLGDCALQISLAIRIVKELNIPLITYNTEDYYYKEYDFMKQTLDAGMVYKLFHRRFCKIFNDMMKLSPKCIYNCDGLRKLYDTTFQCTSTVIYCGTDLQPTEIALQEKEKKILYAGNLSLGRHQALMEIGEALQEIDKELCLEIYGNATEEIKTDLLNAKGVVYKGFVSYQENCENIRNSKLLIHVESFDEYYSQDTRYAFSTKIADYCASGVPSFLYAPEWCESTQYLKENQAAFIVNRKEELVDTLKVALADQRLRQSKIENAQKLVEMNHRKELNDQKFVDVLIRCLE